MQDKQITIFFEGANQEIELFVNGKSAGTHVGGYTRFSFDITNFVRFGEKNNFCNKSEQPL
jgi:beta-galactosidase